MIQYLRFYYLLQIVLLLLSVKSMAQMNPEAERYISTMICKEVPYQVKVLDNNFIINDVNVYPPGGLTEMFATFLIENNLVKDKVFADIGSGCFALGITAAKNGANIVLGSDISEHAIQCARDNLVLNGVTQNVHLFKGEGISPFVPNFVGKIDVIVAGAPWDNLYKDEFESIAPERKVISRAFYDVDNGLIKDVMLKGFDLLAPKGRIFITSSMRTIDRVQKLCQKYKVNYKIMKEADIHNDGNIHYVLELTRTK